VSTEETEIFSALLGEVYDAALEARAATTAFFKGVFGLCGGRRPGVSPSQSCRNGRLAPSRPGAFIVPPDYEIEKQGRTDDVYGRRTRVFASERCGL
jgi:hypothetical protein